MPAISVIVPFYQGEKYLRRCVESLLAQSFSDFELLLVSDGSTDGSLQLARSFSDERISVLEKPHGGVGDTRNFGVRAARGKYLMFVDADDWVEPNTLHDLFRAAEAYGAEMVLFNYVRESEASGVSRDCRLPLSYPEFEKNINSIFLEQLVGPDAVQSPWRKEAMLDCAWRRFYLREWFLKCGLSYYNEQEIMREDLPVSLKAHFFVRRMVVVGGAYYHYRYRPESLSVKYRPHKMEMFLGCFAVVKNFLEEQGVYEQYRQRHLAWLLRCAAHSSFLNCFSPHHAVSFRRRWKEVRGILKHPLLKEAAASPYFKEGTRLDRAVRKVVHTGRTAVVYVFYHFYSRALLRREQRGQGIPL